MTDDQRNIIADLCVAGEIDIESERESRIGFLADYLITSGGRAYVLGISGGVDSLTAAMLNQEAVRRFRANGSDVEFIAVRLPYGIQADERDAQASLDIIRPDRVITVNIKASSDAMMSVVAREAGDLFRSGRQDFLHGNIKARERMIAQYAIAERYGDL